MRNNVTQLLACNARPVDGGEWQQISPYGEFPHPLGMQRFQRPQADGLVKAFNSLLGRLGNLFRGVPIFVGHPDMDATKYTDHRRRGKLLALEAREDGLWGKPEWNALGNENIAEGYHVYPSPVWAFRKSPGWIEPTELLSVGLTNFPNIQGVRPWTANERAAAPVPGLRAVIARRHATPIQRFYNHG